MQYIIEHLQLALDQITQLKEEAISQQSFDKAANYRDSADPVKKALALFQAILLKRHWHCSKRGHYPIFGLTNSVGYLTEFKKTKHAIPILVATTVTIRRSSLRDRGGNVPNAATDSFVPRNWWKTCLNCFTTAIFGVKWGSENENKSTTYKLEKTNVRR